MMSLPVWLPGPMFLLGEGSVFLVRRISVQGRLCWGGLFMQRSPYGKERAVHILRECILVLGKISEK